LKLTAEGFRPIDPRVVVGFPGVERPW
jgi:hypothetical protein